MTRIVPFPWDEAIGLGLGVLRLSPRDFWAMTPRELALAIEARRGGMVTAPARADLERLLRAFPDTETSA